MTALWSHKAYTASRACARAPRLCARKRAVSLNSMPARQNARAAIPGTVSSKRQRIVGRPFFSTQRVTAKSPQAKAVRFHSRALSSNRPDYGIAIGLTFQSTVNDFASAGDVDRTQRTRRSDRRQT